MRNSSGSESSTNKPKMPIDPVIVVINASNQERVTGAAGNAMKLVSVAGKPLVTQSDKLERMPVAGLDAAGTSGTIPDVQWRNGVPQIELRVGPESVNIYRRVRQN